MSSLPDSLEDALTQARESVRSALAAGYTRVQIEILIPELKPLPAAQKLLQAELLRSWLPTPCKVFLPDAGSGALARRDWQGADFAIVGIGELRAEIEPDDQSFVLIAPGVVEVGTVEKLATTAGERPFVLFNPQLEDAAVVGIGYAARKLRQRFLVTFEPAYYLRPLGEGALRRVYPSAWEVWREEKGEYYLLAEELAKPSTETLEKILNPGQAQLPNLWGELQRFLRALNN